MVPHGMSVMVNSPSVFRHTSAGNPERHLDGARWLGVDTTDLGPAEAGPALGDRLVELMKATNMPNGLIGVGYEAADVPALVEGSLPQRRLLDNAPIEIDREVLTTLYEGALSYW